MRVEPAIPAEVLAAVRAPFDAAGAAPVDVPLVQPLNLVLDLVGEALRARLFIVQAEGGPEFCLRPDFTAPVARRHLEAGAASGRYFYQGKAFRSAADHPGRPEEFLQIGLERFEDAETSMLEAEVETLTIAWAAAKAGGRDDLSLWLGDASLFAAFVESLDLAPALASRLVRIVGRPRLLRAELARAGQAAPEPADGGLADLLADLPESAASGLLREVWQLAGIDPVGGRGPGEIAERLVRKAEARRAPALTQDQADSVAGFLAIEDSPGAAFEAIRRLSGPNDGALKAALSGWQERLARLAAADVPSAALRFAAGLGHAFDYYDGLSFEVRSAALGAERPVAAGGRYDGLLARLGGPEQSRAVGCMVRPWRAFAQGEA